MNYKIICDSSQLLRLDQFIQKQHPELSRSVIKKNSTDLYINDKVVKLSTKVNEDDYVRYTLKDIEILEKLNYPMANKIDLDIIYQDDDLLVINKKAGQVVHPAPGHKDDTIANHIMTLVPDRTIFEDPTRPGIVHRLDKDTSGLMVIALNPRVEKALKNQFKQRTVTKIYNTLVHGVLFDNGEIDFPIGRDPIHWKRRAVNKSGSTALTEYKILKRYNNYTHLEIVLHTGRTHQIRVHLKAIKHSVLGDYLYNRSENEKEHLYLLAKKLTFIHPISKKELTFEIPLPDFYKNKLEILQ